MIKQKIKSCVYSVLRTTYKWSAAPVVRPAFHRLRGFLNYHLVSELNALRAQNSTLMHQMQMLQATVQQAGFVAPLRHEIRLAVTESQILQQRVRRLEQMYEETVMPSLRQALRGIDVLTHGQTALTHEQTALTHGQAALTHAQAVLSHETTQQLAALKLDIERIAQQTQLEINSTASNISITTSKKLEEGVETICQVHHKSMNDLDGTMHDLVDKIESIALGVIGKSSSKL